MEQKSEDRKFNTDFHMAEYEGLRREIEVQIADRRRVEIHSVVAIFIVYAWLFSRPPNVNPELMQIAMALPIGAAVYGLLKWEALMIRTIQIGAYIRKIEERLTVAPELGWEHYLRTERQGLFSVFGAMEGHAGRLFWVLLVAATIAVFVWFTGYFSQSDQLSESGSFITISIGR